jgi:LuxR family transcriptional regulator, maltose regulon positive regulatory protein
MNVSAALLPAGARIVAAKLYPPPVSAYAAPRLRLITRLESIPDRRLTVIAAPAGFGKTTLLSQWLATTSQPVAWVALDAGDNDPATFMTYLALAIRSRFPAACGETLALVQSPQLPPSPYVVNVLLNDIMAVGEAFFLVLEEYHLIHSSAIHDLMARLIQYVPANLHLVLASRAEPPLHLARQRAHGNLLDLAAEDLRFTPQEVDALLAAAKSRLSRGARATLIERTEGWPLALHLALLSLSESRDPSSIVHTLEDGSHRVIVEFLTEDVITALPPTVQDFLRVTSLFDRFSASLADAVWDKASQELDAKSALAAIQRANLFLTPLDAAGTWHRYHPLFRTVLQGQLRAQTLPAELATLHRRASAWFAGEGLLEEGLYHALAGEDMMAAVELVERSVQPLLNHENWRRVERLLQQLPEALIERRPALLLARAWVSFLCGKFAVLPQLLDAAQAGLAQMEAEGEQDALRGQIESLQASLLATSANQDSQAAFELATSALQRLPPEYGLPRRQAIAYYAVTSRRLGRGAEARDVLEAALARSPSPVSTFTQGAQLALAHLVLMNGELEQFESISNQMVADASWGELPISLSWGTLGRSLAAYAQGRLHDAQSILEQAVRAPYQAQLGAARSMGFMLALLHQMKGEPQQAEEALDTTRTLVAQVARFGVHQRLVESFTARLNVARGDVEAAVRWADSVNPDTLPDFPDDFEQARLSYASVRVAQGTAESLAEAIPLLHRLSDEADAIHYLWRKIGILPVLALAYGAQGDERAALDTLAQAVSLARPARYAAAFLEHGQRMRDLLCRLATTSDGGSFLAHLLASFDLVAPVPVKVATNPRPGSAPPRVLDSGMPLDITRRELEVLRLLERGWANKEIAQALVVSPATVARHTANLYAKLGVSRRGQAVRRAGELGLLLPS